MYSCDKCTARLSAYRPSAAVVVTCKLSVSSGQQVNKSSCLLFVFVMLFIFLAAYMYYRT